MLKRYEGSEIVAYEQREFDEYTLPLGGMKAGSQALERTQPLEGRLTQITYVAQAGRTAVEVLRNYEQELGNAGFTMLFQGRAAELGDMFASTAGYPLLFQLSNTRGEQQRYLAAHAARDTGGVHVALYATPHDNPNALPHRTLQAGQVLYRVDLIEAKPREQRMVTVDAEEMAGSIAQSGAVSLYGILFDTNSAQIRPESTPTLEQAARLLAQQPTRSLLVVGHTDNVGEFEFNRDLSQRRAAAVVRALVETHGVAANRLTPFGASFASPRASNRDEDGRAKNRRVELVER